MLAGFERPTEGKTIVIGQDITAPHRMSARQHDVSSPMRSSRT